MIYKKRKPMIHTIFSLIMYIALTIFISFGLFNLLNLTYEDVNKLNHGLPTSKVDLNLVPIKKDSLVSNNIIIEETNNKIEEPFIKDKKVLDAMKVIEKYYTDIISKNIESHFSSNSDNMCKISFKVDKSELKIMSCDDYTFKRQIELALSKGGQYKNKIINGVDLSNEVVYFDYSISGSK